MLPLLDHAHGCDDGARTTKRLESEHRSHDAFDGAMILLRRYKAETDLTPLVWLQQARIDKAKRLLEVSAMSLGEVVEKVGDLDVATFSRLFVRHVGGASPPAAVRSPKCHEPQLLSSKVCSFASLKHPPRGPCVRCAAGASDP